MFSKTLKVKSHGKGGNTKKKGSLFAETGGVEVSSKIGRSDGSFLFEGPNKM